MLKLCREPGLLAVQAVGFWLKIIVPPLTVTGLLSGGAVFVATWSVPSSTKVPPP
jgi:hypothetical protein